jgi:hypothetical protein
MLRQKTCVSQGARVASGIQFFAACQCCRVNGWFIVEVKEKYAHVCVCIRHAPTKQNSQLWRRRDRPRGMSFAYASAPRKRRKEELENNLLHNTKHLIDHDLERARALGEHKNPVGLRNIARAVFSGRLNSPSVPSLLRWDSLYAELSAAALSSAATTSATKASSHGHRIAGLLPQHGRRARACHLILRKLYSSFTLFVVLQHR